MNPKELFRQPDGTITNNVEAYTLSWDEMGKSVEWLFPDFEIYSFDPGIRLMNKPKFGGSPYSFMLPLDAAHSLIQVTGEMKAKQANMEGLLKQALDHLGRFGWSADWMQEVGTLKAEIQKALTPSEDAPHE